MPKPLNSKHETQMLAQGGFYKHQAPWQACAHSPHKLNPELSTLRKEGSFFLIF